MRIKTIFGAIILTVTVVYGNDVLQRLQKPQYDAEELKQINSTERKLNNFLEKTLQQYSSLKEPYTLEPLNYNKEHIEIFLANLKMTAENVSITAKAYLLQQILRIDLAVKNVFVDGISLIKSVSTQQENNFRFLSKNVVCSGSAGLLSNTNDINVEWVLIDCSQKTFSHIENIVFNTSSGNFQNGKITLGDNLDKALLRSIETVLNSESLLKLNKALHKLPMTVKESLRFIGNTKSAKLEASDSNTFLDSAISVAAYFIKKRYNDSVQVPDIREAIPCSILTILHCDTGFIAQNGFARNVSSIHRVGNARIIQRNVTVDFSGTLKFQKLDIFYNKYKASVLGIGPSGSLRILSEPVTIGIQLKINFENRKIYLTGFKLKKLGKTQVEVSGLGKLLEKVLKRITACIIGIFNVIISRIIEERVASYTKEALDKNTIDDIINGNITV